jgi:hypothetical protein
LAELGKSNAMKDGQHAADVSQLGELAMVMESGAEEGKSATALVEV